jgi:hypothetical protein
MFTLKTLIFFDFRGLTDDTHEREIEEGLAETAKTSYSQREKLTSYSIQPLRQGV